MSRRRSAAPAAASADLIRPLLRHGARFFTPGPEIVNTAAWLAHLDIIEVRTALVVRCADPLDQDYPPPSRDCDGLIALRPEVDEGGGDYRCPSCERIVFPAADEKRRYPQTTVVLKRSGIERYLVNTLGAPAKGRSFCDGVLKLPTAGLNAFVCLVEFCSDRQYLRRATAIAQPCVYVTIEPDTPGRLLADAGIRHVELADILTGKVCLTDQLTDAATSASSTMANVDVAILATGALMVGTPAAQSSRRRRFAVQAHPTGFWVDDRLIVDPSRSSACRILQALVQQYAEALAAGADVRALSVEDLADTVEEGEADARDAESIRRTLDRVRDQITTAIRRDTGKAIGANDVIETVSRTGTLKGAKGYRLNPHTVVLAATAR